MNPLFGVLFGLGAAFSQSLSYIFSRMFVGRFPHSTVTLLVTSHVIMGCFSSVTLMLFKPESMPSLESYLWWLLGTAFFYLCAQVCLFLALRQADASRVSPLLGVKIFFLAVITVPLLGETFSKNQMVAVFFCVCSALMLSWSRGRIGWQSLLWVMLTCLGYSLSDVCVVTKPSPGHYILRATNPDYEDLEADESMRTFARLKEILNPFELAIGQELMREDIPTLFGKEFNPGNWHSGHIVLKDQRAHVLLVTLNKQGKGKEHRYHDYWVDESTFHWQSQNSTTPESKRGKELIEHQKRGITVHLFVRERKLAGGKAAPFTYYGAVNYKRHNGSAPMSIEWRIDDLSQ